MSSWVEGRVAFVRHWTDNLFSLGVLAPEVTFDAGQFARLLPAPPGSKEPMLGRPYSFVNPPHASPHEFYAVIVPHGPLSPQLAALSPDDPVWMLPRANGFFTIDEVPPADALWALATEPVSDRSCRSCAPTPVGEVPAHRAGPCSAPCARAHLYQCNRGHRARASWRIHVHPRGVSRGASPRAARTHTRADRRWKARGAGRHRARAGERACDAVRNPQMVDDTQEALKAREHAAAPPTRPGHVTVEAYW